MPANLGDDVEGVGVVELTQARQHQLRELQAQELPARLQHLRALVRLSRPAPLLSGRCRQRGRDARVGNWQTCAGGPNEDAL